jgi:pyruvate carboxylase
MIMERIVQGMSPGEALKILRQADGYFLTNTTRDLSQSDFKNRILLPTDLLAAEPREKVNYF